MTRPVWVSARQDRMLSLCFSNDIVFDSIENDIRDGIFYLIQKKEASASFSIFQKRKTEMKQTVSRSVGRMCPRLGFDISIIN